MKPILTITLAAGRSRGFYVAHTLGPGLVPIEVVDESPSEALRILAEWLARTDLSGFLDHEPS